MEAEHRTDDQRQIANAYAWLPTMEIQVGDAEGESDSPDDGDGDEELGQAVKDGGPAVVAPGVGELKVHARRGDRDNEVDQPSSEPGPGRGISRIREEGKWPAWGRYVKRSSEGKRQPAVIWWGENRKGWWRQGSRARHHDRLAREEAKYCSCTNHLLQVPPNLPQRIGSVPVGKAKTTQAPAPVAEVRRAKGQGPATQSRKPRTDKRKELELGSRG